MVTAADALAVTLHEVGCVDMDRMAELLGRTREQVVAELGEAVFLDPALSQGSIGRGRRPTPTCPDPVRDKLAAAEAAAAHDPRYVPNVEALRRVQPEDLRPSDITARLGGPWLPADDSRAFSAEVIGIETMSATPSRPRSGRVDLSRSRARQRPRPNGARRAATPGCCCTTR